jgi:hypothetical protein
MLKATSSNIKLALLLKDTYNNLASISIKPMLSLFASNIFRCYSQLISSSNLILSIALSTMEVEYMALFDAARETLIYLNFFLSLLIMILCSILFINN